MVALRGLQAAVRTVALGNDAERASRGGWVFEPAAPDPLVPGARDLRETCARARPRPCSDRHLPLTQPPSPTSRRCSYDALVPGGYTGRCTAPLLALPGGGGGGAAFLCNDSVEICAALSDVVAFPQSDVDLVPPHLRDAISDLNARISADINNGAPLAPD